MYLASSFYMACWSTNQTCVVSIQAHLQRGFYDIVRHLSPTSNMKFYSWDAREYPIVNRRCAYWSPTGLNETCGGARASSNFNPQCRPVNLIPEFPLRKSFFCKPRHYIHPLASWTWCLSFWRQFLSRRAKRKLVTSNQTPWRSECQ